MRNDGTLPGLADDDVVEVRRASARGGPMPLPQAPLAPELLGLVQHVAAYERLAARAALDVRPGHGRARRCSPIRSSASGRRRRSCSSACSLAGAAR